MSVLLTAGKNAWKRNKSAKKTRSGSARPGSAAGTRPWNSTPPMSNANTTVWYWSLEGVAMTLMYDVIKNEVWCNGRVLKTTPERFSEDAMSSAINFVIYDEYQPEAVYDGTIVRLPNSACLSTTGLATGSYVYRLYVDGVPIMEHTLDATRRDVVGLPLSHPEALGAHALPSYEEAVQQAPAYSSEDWKTETKGGHNKYD